MTGIVAHTYPEWWLKLTGQAAHLSTDYSPLYEKYQDDATSPAKESLETITKKIVDDNSDFYFILFNGEKAGAVRVKWHKGQKVHKNGSSENMEG